MTDFFDCKGIAEIYKKQLVQDFKALNYVPTLLTILTNDSKPCVQYAKAIDKHCSTFGVLHKNIKATDVNSLLQLITQANKDANIQGIFLFSPVHFPDMRDEELMDLIDPIKDIEGLHSLNLGYLEKFRIHLENDLKCV